MRPVAISRWSALGPFGLDGEALQSWAQRPPAQRDLAGPITSVDEPWLPFERACEAPWDRKVARKALPDRKAIKLMTRPVQLGLHAALSAWSGTEVEPAQRGMWVGADVAVDEDWTFREPIHASVVDGAFSMHRFAVQGQDLLNPLWLVKGLSNNVLAFVAKTLDIQGANDNLEAGEAGALQAISTAAASIAEDRCEQALAGGCGSTATVEVMLHLARHGVTDWLPAEAAGFVELRPGSSGELGVLGWASGRCDGVGHGPHAPDGCVGVAQELLAKLQAQLGSIRDVIPGPRLAAAWQRTGWGSEQLGAVLGDDGIFALDRPGWAKQLWSQLGDAGAGSGGLLAPLAMTSSFHFPTALLAAGPGGEVEAVVVGPLL